MTSLRLTLFGLPRIERDGVPLVLERRKALALLAYLALSPTPLSRDLLAELLWPERDGPTARTDNPVVPPGAIPVPTDVTGLYLSRERSLSFTPSTHTSHQ
jgi:hypothetical protein